MGTLGKLIRRDYKDFILITAIVMGVTVILISMLATIFGFVSQKKTHLDLQRELEEVGEILAHQNAFTSQEKLKEISLFPEIKKLCQVGILYRPAGLLRLLDVAKTGSGASIVFVVDKKGVIVSSTTLVGQQNQVGKRYSDKRIFEQFEQGQDLMYAKKSPFDNKNAIYMSMTVWDENEEKVLGVLVAVYELDATEKALQIYTERMGLVSPEGNIIVSNEIRLLNQTLTEGSKDVDLPPRIITEKTEAPLVLLDEHEVRWDGHLYAVGWADTVIPDWKIVGMKRIRYPMVNVIIIGFAFFVMLLSGVGVFYGMRLRRDAEKQLKKMMGMYSSLTQAAPDAIGLFDFKGRIISGNQQIAHLFGTGETHSFEGNNVYDFIHPDDRVSIKLFVKELMSHKGTSQVHFLLKSGVPVEMNASSFQDEIQHIKAFHAVIRDLSWRRQAEASLQDSEAKFKNLIENIGMGIIVVNEQMKVLYVNGDVQRTFPQISTDEHYETFNCMFKQEQSLCSDCPVRKAFVDGIIHERIHKKEKKGYVQHMRMIASPVKNKRGEIYAVIIMLEDITEREQLLAGIESSRERFRTLVSNFPGVVYRCLNDSRWTMEFISDGIETLSGYPWTDFVHNKERSYTSIIHPEDRMKVREAVEAGLTAQEPFMMEYRIVDKNGKTKWVYEKGQVVLDDEGNIIWLDGAIFDISEKKQVEEERLRLVQQLSNSQKLESIGTLAAGIAHEINTPIQFIGDNTGFLKEGVGDLVRALDNYREIAKRNNTVKEELDQIEQEIDLAFLRDEIPNAIEQTQDGIGRVANIVKAMKEFSHIGDSEMKQEDLNKAIESTVVISKSEWKYFSELKIDLDPELPMVLCFIGDIKQVVLNLIINAAHAIYERFEDKGKDGVISISTKSLDDQIVIRIQDNGNGIPEEIRDQVFDPFFTTKEVGRGTGQGLAMAYTTIVEKHGGTLSFETEIGQGTTFIIHLPQKNQ